MNVEGLIVPIPEVCHPMIEEKVPIRKKETAATRKVVIVDQGANLNVKSIHPAIGQAPDHLHILLRRETRKGNLFLQILLRPIDLIGKS